MSKKIKALLISPFFFPTNTYQQELVKKITKLYPEINITILCYQTTNNRAEEFETLKVHYVSCFQPLKGQFAIPNYPALIKMLNQLKKDNRFDIVFCETRFFDSTWWIPYLVRSWEIPAILIDHCASSIKHKSRIISVFGKFLDWFIVNIFVNQYPLVLTSNKRAQEYLKSLGLKNLEFLGTGVDSQFFKPKKGLNNKKLTITFASRLIYTKGIKIFYDSVKILIDKYPDLVVKIAGEGEYFKKVKKNIITDKLQDKVFLLGALKRKEIQQLLSETDIFVYPSFHHDGLPNVILEAAASGCAVISNRVGDVDELIKNNITGILIENLDPVVVSSTIEELINDKPKRLNLGECARKEVVKNYSWEDVAKRMVDYMFKLVFQP